MLLAQINGLNNPGNSTRFNNYNTILSLLVSRILLFAIFIAGFFFFIRLLAAGFSLMTSAGDPAKIQSATKSLTHALIGLVIVVTAFFIAQIIQTVFGLNLL